MQRRGYSFDMINKAYLRVEEERKSSLLTLPSAAVTVVAVSRLDL